MKSKTSKKNKNELIFITYIKVNFENIKMAKYMGKVGFAVGIVIGIITRENYNYTMGQKMNDMSKDYEQIKTKLDLQKE